MVREPVLLTTATSAYPTTDQIAVVRIARPVPAVPEECALPKMIWNIQIIRNAFQTKIEIMNLRNPWEIEARINRRAVRAKWRILINHHRIHVDLQPIAEAWHPVGEVKCRKALCGIAARAATPMRVERFQKIAPREWISRSTKLSCKPNAQFQVMRRMKAEFRSMDKGLGRKVRAQQRRWRKGPLLTRKLRNEELGSDRSQRSGDKRNLKWGNRIDFQHGDGRSIAAE